jgi:hypothetical protein
MGVHRNNKADLSLLVGGILFILTAGPDVAQISVHLEPWLPSTTMGNLLNRYLEEGRSLDGWDTLFRGLITGSEDDSFSVSEVNNIIKRVDGREDQEKFGAMPYKKRARLDTGTQLMRLPWHRWTHRWEKRRRRLCATSARNGDQWCLTLTRCENW